MITGAVAAGRRMESALSLTPAVRRELYEQMVLTRVFETEAERQYKAARIGGYCHLSSGQEATTSASCMRSSDDDLLVTGYRCHGFALARGVSPESVMAELFGRSDGCAHGRGGSMHMLDVSRGFYGGWGIVAGQLPVATGLALALVRQRQAPGRALRTGRRRREHGRLARVAEPRRTLESADRLPGGQQRLRDGHGGRARVRRARALQARVALSGCTVSGLTATTSTPSSRPPTGCCARRASERRPAVLEAVTYRYRGHSVADAGLAYRSKNEIAEHQAHDPIARVREQLQADGVGEDELDAIDHAADARVAAAVESALASPEPSAQLAWGMYARGSDAQFARMRPGSAFGEEELISTRGSGMSAAGRDAAGPATR